MNIGKGLKKLLNERDWSQKKLSEKTGISTTSISLLIKDKTEPKKETLEKIGEALKVKPEVLILLSIEKEDVPDAKKKHYEDLWPAIEKTLLGILSEEKNT